MYRANYSIIGGFASFLPVKFTAGSGLKPELERIVSIYKIEPAIVNRAGAKQIHLNYN